MARRSTTKTPITGADRLNDRVLPFPAEHGMGMIRILTDRGTGYCGQPETHDDPLYLALNDIEHTTQARHPQTNGLCERFHKTILQELYQLAFRKKLYLSLQELQATWRPGSATTTTASEPTRVRGVADAPLYRPCSQQRRRGRKKS